MCAFCLKNVHMLFLLIIIIVDANLVTVSSSEPQRSDSSPKAALLVCGRDMIASSERNFSRSRRPRKGEQIFTGNEPMKLTYGRNVHPSNFTFL